MESLHIDPVSISGMGCITCMGAGVNNVWESALSERTGITNGLGRISDSQIHEFNDELGLKQDSSRALTLALSSITEALHQAQWGKLTSNDGLIIATTTGQISLWETELTRFVQNKISAQRFGEAWKSQTLGSIMSNLVKHLKFEGPTILLTSACSASTQALALGKLWIEQGRVKRCLIGGVETLSELTIEGFKSLQLLSLNPAQPFDENRNGINLAEGAAFFCLEQNPKLPLATLSGFGISSDAFHMTAPHPEGRGSFEAMRTSLTQARLSPSEISWIHAHGTGSKANDQAEASAVSRLFGDTWPWISSTKSLHGHTLGASGAVESVLCVQGLRFQKILKTSGLKNPDPLLPLNHPQSHMDIRVNHILKNTLGFGGSNAALIFSHPSSSGRST